MPSDSSGKEEKKIFKSLIERYTSLKQYEIAKFYAERLYYEFPNSAHLYYLANCYYNQGKLKQAYLILQDSPYTSNKQNKYLYALICFSLNKLEEAEKVLQPMSYATGIEDINSKSLENVPGEAGGIFLLGKICRRQNRKEYATKYFSICLEVDPFFWGAIVELSEMGVTIDLNSMLGLDNSAISLPFQTSIGLLNQQEECRSIQSTPHSTFSRKSLIFSTSKSLNMPFSSPAPMPPLEFDDMYLRFPSHGKYPGSAGQSSYRAANMKGRSDSFEETDRPKSYIDSYTKHSHDLEDSEPPYYGQLPPDSFHGESKDTYSGSKSQSYSYDPRMSLFGHSTPGSTPKDPLAESNDLKSSFSGYSHVRKGALFDSSSRSQIGTVYESRIDGANDTIDASMAPYSFDKIQSSLKNQSSSRDPDDPTSAPNTGRRVSFGPTARLSFSGAFDASSQTKPSVTNAMSSSSVSMGSMAHTPDGNKLDLDRVEEDQGVPDDDFGSLEEDRQPHKFQKMNPLQYAPYSDKPASRHGVLKDNEAKLPKFNRKSLSPFPIESSPIIYFQHQAGSDVKPANSTGATAAYANTSEPSQLRFDESSINESDQSEYLNLNDSTKESSTYAKNQNHEGGLSTKPLARNDEKREMSYNNMTHTPVAQQASVYYAETAEEAKEYVKNLVGVFARAYQCLCQYKCAECIDILEKQLPVKQVRSALASQWAGKAYYEMNDYPASIVAYKEMIQREPFRLQGLEFLSTALWHLKKDKDLCALAQQVLEIDRFAPETWCVVGNSLSLQKEIDSAIKYFQRAIQLDPHGFPYAYTLLGHEQLHNEDFEKAITSFRKAILINDRHYNAWYGLGSIYFRQERYELSEYHFRKALSINSSSSVLHCYLGMTLHSQNNLLKTKEALQVLDSATQKDKRNPQIHFQVANILISCDQVEEAISSLHLVEEQVPKEAPVHALLGELYFRMEDMQKAIYHINIAMDLDPKENASLKGILESIEEPVRMA